MEQYIPKSAVVAEIERRIKNLYPKEGQGMVITKILKDHYEDLLSFIDTSEVKEVDLEHLEQEVKDFCYKFDGRKDKWYDMTPHDKNIMISPTWSNFAMQLAKHFFELGMTAGDKAQKGE